MYGLKRSIKLGMLQLILDETQDPDIRIVLLGKTYQDSEHSINDGYWEYSDGTLASYPELFNLNMEVSTDTPYLYNANEITFSDMGVTDDAGYIAIFNINTTEFILIQQLPEIYEWQGFDYVVPEQGFRIYI